MNTGLDLCSLSLQCIAIILLTNMKQFTNTLSTVQAQSLERFDANACQQNADDVISCQISYVTCLDECRSRWRCIGVSYHRRLSLCRLHMSLLSSGTTQCVGYVLSTKNTWNTKTSNQCQCDGQNTCTRNGRPTCQDCPVNFPVAPQHGYIRGNRRVVGSKVAFGCDVGFTLQGDMTSVCEITGQWANYTVTCHNTSQTLTSTAAASTSSKQTPIVLGAPTAAPTSSSTTRTTSALSTTKRTTSAIPTTSTNSSTTSTPTPIAPTSTIPATSTNVSTTSTPTPIMTMSSTTSTTLSITSTNASTTSTASTASTTNTTYSTTSSTASTTNTTHPLTTSTTASTTNTTTNSTTTSARTTTMISTTHSTTSSNTSLTTANSVATCKDSWLMGNTSCYLIQDFALTYADHQTLCVLNGGHLVYINSPEENAFIKRIASNYITVRFNSLRMAWFGIEDYDLDGQWNFTDTPTEVTWFDWDVSQPQKRAYGRWQRCGCIMYNKNSIWHDCWCGYEMPAICENEL